MTNTQPAGTCHGGLRTQYSKVKLCVQDKARLDITRLQKLSSGFGSFTTSGIRSTAADTNVPALDDTSKEVLRIVFNRNGSYLQVRRLGSFASIELN